MKIGRSCADSQKVALKKNRHKKERQALWSNDFHGRRAFARADCFPWRRLRIASLDVAGERHRVQEQTVDVAIAEARHVAQLRRTVEDFDGERVVRVGRLNPDRQPRAWCQSTDAGGAGVVAEAGDGKRVLGDVASGHGWPLPLAPANLPGTQRKRAVTSAAILCIFRFSCGHCAMGGETTTGGPSKKQKAESRNGKPESV